MTNLYELIHRRVQAAPRRARDRDRGRRAPHLCRPGRALRPLGGRLARLGVGPGDRVAVQVEKSVANLLLYLACLRRGAVYLPLNTAYTLAELDYFFGDAEPALIVCDPARRAEIAALGGAAVAQVVTLDDQGQGDLVEALDQEAPEAGDRVGRRRRPRGAALHLGHHRARQGRHADPPQSRLQRADVGRRLGLQRGGRAAARPAAVPRARAVRRLQHRAPCRRGPVVPAALRCRAGARSAAARDGHDGRADLLYPAARAGRAVGCELRRRPPVRLRLGAAARAYLSRIRGAHGAPHPRALRHDRDRYEHVQPAARRAPARHRRAAAARRRDQGRGRGRARARPGRDRRARGARAQRVQGLLAHAREDRGGVSRRTASSSPATLAGSGRTATSRSSAGRRI